MLTFYDRAFQLVICTSLLTLFSVAGAVSTLAQPTVDGDLSDADYQTVATEQNSNSGFGSAIDATEIVYFADDDNSTLYVGVKGQLDVSNSNGIGLMLNFQALSGTSAGTDLATSGGGHYTSSTVRADFEVDYMFAMNPGSGSSNVFYDGVERVGGSSTQFLGSSDQSGTSTTNENSDFFDTGSVTLAFNNGGGADQGFEMSIPYAQLGASGVSEVGAMEAFAFVVSNTGFYSDVTVPGNVTGGNLGSSPNFNTLSGGPYHGSKSFTTAGSGDWTTTGTWTNSTVPFNGADVEVSNDVTLNTDATVHDLTISSGTFDASDGSDRTLTLKNGGTLSLNGGSFNATTGTGDGTLVASGNGNATIPGSITLNDVTASTGIDFGGNNATVNGTFTINGGGAVITNPPTYGESSTLTYNTGGTYGRFTEWTPGATSGAGVPQNVTLSNNTILNLSGREGDETSTFQCNGDFTVESGSELNLDFINDNSGALEEPLTVAGKFTNNGTTKLSRTFGGDLKVKGNFVNEGTFTDNGAAIFFVGSSGTQELDVKSGNFAFLVFDNTGDGVKLINNDVTVEGAKGDVLQFLDDGGLDLNGQTMTLSGDGGNIEVDGGARTITSSSSSGRGTFVVDGRKTITSTDGGVLELGGSVTLNPKSQTLTTNGNLTLKSRLDENDDEKKTAYISGNGNGTIDAGSVNDDQAVTFERALTKSDDASHFRMIGAPTTTEMDGTGSAALLSNIWTQTDDGSGGDFNSADSTSDQNADPSVFTYNEHESLTNGLSQGWTNVRDLDNTQNLKPLKTGDLNPGRGFLAFLFADDDPTDGSPPSDAFPKTLTATGSVQDKENDANTDPVNPTITFTNDGDNTDQNGWNLIANPFMAPIDWELIETDRSDVDATIYVWNPSANMGNGTYATYTANGSGTNNQTRYIPPFQAFFVKATGSSPSIGGIASGDKAIGQNPEFKSNDPGFPQIALRLRAGENSTGETTAFRFAEGASMGKDAYDAFQLEPLSTARTLVASEMDGTDALFDHQNRPMPTEADTIDLALDITEGGTYSLAASALQNLPGDWKVILENTDSGARWDLGAGESATFSVEGTQSKSTAEDVSPAALLKDGPTVAKASTDNGLPSYRLFVGPAAALPVELASFDATTEGTKVQLSWQTASETNNAGFAIERRAQGGTWSQVGSRDGAGTTTEAQTYRFTDENLPFEAEQVRYRLRQEDLDGSTTLSDEVTVDLGAPSKARLHAPFPNPSAQRATVRYEVPQAATVEIAVYDVLGRRVETVVNGQVPAGREQRTLQTGTLAPGTYFVRLRIGDTVQTQRLSVVR